MNSIITSLVFLVLGFFRNTWGSVHSPYATYRALHKEDPYQLFIVFFLTGLYFFLISPIRLHTLHPFLLTINASRLFTLSLAAYLGICGFLWGVGRVFKKSPELRAILLSWGYSLVPTLLWFFTTSLFYVVLPPPRYETWPGRMFSILYLAFSLSLFLWKGMLYYLTLRFTLKLDLQRIIVVSCVFFPLLLVYSWGMYQLGIFRVPFV